MADSPKELRREIQVLRMDLDNMERDAYANGFKAGQENMRERSARVAVDTWGRANWYAREIRALPVIEPGQEKK